MPKVARLDAMKGSDSTDESPMKLVGSSGFMKSHTKNPSGKRRSSIAELGGNVFYE